ncbi:carboxypeptidase-like regulatory domain-containing protein [Mucilaginibacter lacusdianchii]|uniref:carboxypeptidase-like regulatory domain-containing protein n=1 Tax=Mucilaginibacter lacusdianchii TaxID=2684211 RepID=UPI00131DB1D4|nr:carboxypeptidase-like regulatory domain-containing protein [Mucilaginibacter sp. JXJ CY 39]
MSAKKTDISQIEKYLAGELDTRAMHELERQALNDPFLMDALEGYERASKNQQANLTDLSNRLQQRVHTKRRMVLWPAIAASVLLFAGLGTWWLLRSPRIQPRPPQSSIVQSKSVTPKPAVSDSAIKQNAPQIAQTKHKFKKAHRTLKTSVVNEQVLAAVLPPADKSAAYERQKFTDTLTTPNELKEVVVIGYGAQKKVSITGAVASIKADSLTSTLSGRVAGVNVVTKNGRPGTSSRIQIRGINTQSGVEPLYIVDGKLADKISDLKQNDVASINVLKDTSATAIYGSRAANGVIIITTKKSKLDNLSEVESKQTQLIAGRILSKSGNEPLPGVAVKLAGKNTGVTTDANGRFKIQAQKGDVLDIAYVGYQNEKVKVKGHDSLQIKLNERQSALSEVVVVGYGTPREVIEEAHPTNGWQEFNKYLKENANLADGKTGVVKLTFVVNADNSLSDFKIVRSLNAQADQEAIELIKDGPSWQHNVNGQPEKVTVRIRFRK